MAATGEYTIADLAEVFTISRATVYRTLQRADPQAGASRVSCTPGSV
jgi:DeoR/GlpR family transcriptional regulator of sugar metabolism